MSVPQQRKLAKKFRALPLENVEELLHSKYHEERLIALFILVEQFSNADDKTKEVICHTYLQNTKYVNNWDLVDSSADKILGEYLLGKDTNILKKLAVSESIWERRKNIEQAP